MFRVGSTPTPSTNFTGNDMKTNAKQKQQLIEFARRQGFPKVFNAVEGDRVAGVAGSPPKRTGHFGTCTGKKFRGQGVQVLWDNGETSRVPWYCLELLETER